MVLAGLAAVATSVVVASALAAVDASTAQPREPALTTVQALVLGLVEGVTEYLPVSSTGHLILAQRLMGIGERPAEREAADAYVICIQLGAIVAVLALYRARLAQMLRGLLGRDPGGRRLTVNLVLAFAPAAAAGLLLGGTVKRHLFGPWPVVAAWLVGGLVILAVSRWRGGRPAAEGIDLLAVTWRVALAVGAAQCMALWPGTSRSLVTIVGGLLMGLSMPAAVELSFLLGVLTLGAATGWDLLRHGSAIVASFGWSAPLLGFAVAAISAAVAVRWMVGWLERRGLAVFGWYRIALAVVVALWLLQ